jgi:CW-type Zinc Finger
LFPFAHICTIPNFHFPGQNQPVFAYRLLTAGSVEEKVYARTVTKSGVASRVVDNKTMERFFTAREISDLQTTNTWVQCDHCEKWRMMLGGVEEEELPEEWFCEMNANDPDNNNCDAEEKGELWYANRLASAQQLDAAQVLFGLSTAPPPANDFNSADSSLSKEDTQRLVDKDPVLKHLLKITENKKKSTLVSRHYFHEALMQIQDIDEEPEQDSKVAASNAHAVGADSKKSKKRATLENISSKASKHPRSESPKKSKGLEDDSVDYARAGDSKTSVAPHSNDKKRARSLPPAGRRQTPTQSKKSAENRDDMPRRNTPGKSPASRDLLRVKSEKDSVPTTSPSPRKNPPRAGRSPTGEPAAAVGAAAAVAPSRRSSKTRETGQAAKRVKKEPKVGGKGGKENAIEISDSPAVAKKPPPCEKKPETIELLHDSDDDEDETPSYNYEMTV